MMIAQFPIKIGQRTILNANGRSMFSADDSHSHDYYVVLVQQDAVLSCYAGLSEHGQTVSAMVSIAQHGNPLGLSEAEIHFPGIGRSAERDGFEYISGDA